MTKGRCGCRCDSSWAEAADLNGAVRTPEWWTPADAAELNVRAFDLVEAVADCACGGAQPECVSCRTTIEGLVRWRDRRVLRSKAEHLRREQLRSDRRLRASSLTVPALVRLVRDSYGGVAA